MNTARHGTAGKLLAALLAIALFASSSPCQELVLAARQATAATAEGSAERLQALLQEAAVLQRFDVAEALARSEAAAALAMRRGDNVMHALALAERANALIGFGSPDACLAALQEAEQVLPKDAPVAARAKLALTAASAYWTYDRPPECLTALRQAVDLSDESGDAGISLKANILALGIVGWPEDQTQEAQRMIELAQASGSQGLLLQARVIDAVRRQRAGDIASASIDFDNLIKEARRIGDRASEGYLAQVIARRYALNDVGRTHELAVASLNCYQSWGQSEFIAEAQHYLAQLAVFREQPREGLAYCEAAIAVLEGKGMRVRMLEVLAGASHIASIQGLTDKAREYGARHTELNKEVTTAATYNQRGRLWRESTNLRHSLREVQNRHQQELDDMAARVDRIVLIASTSGGLLLIVVSLLLLRSTRRLERANTNLTDAMAASEVLQEERASLQQNLQQIERLDSIGLLAGGFAHDFNNILVSVLGNAQLLLCGKGLDKDQREMLEQIEQSSHRAAGLCKDILAYAHAAPTPMSAIDLRELISGLLPLAKSGFGAGIEVSCDLGDELQFVLADRSQIEQVFLNVLVNAGDAIEDRGTIRISMQTRELDGTPPSGHWFGEFSGVPRTCVAVSVQDSGQGMNAETVRRIFDPFFSTRFAGRGIGLAAVFGILRRHQGVVEVVSEVGHGTKFTVYLPQQDVRDAASPSKPEPAPRRLASSVGEVAATILVVDDESSVCHVASETLRKGNHKVLVAASGHEALDLFKREREEIALALIDVTMPDMDGPTLARNLREQSPDIAIVLMTGHAESAVRTAELDVPMLSKPFDLNDLVDMANQELAKSRGGAGSEPQ